MKKVCIVLPVYNEKESLNKFVISLLKFFKNNPKYRFEIVISDSHSTDGTDKIAKKLTKLYKNVHYINGQPGIGSGLYNGHMFAIKHLKADILIQIDADGQADKKIINDLVNTIESGYDVAIGSRFLKGGKNKLSLERRFFSICSSLYCRLMIGPVHLHEFTNSARAFTPRLFKKINWDRVPLERKTFIAIPAQINEAIIAGAKWKEVPLVFNNRPSGYSKNKVLSYSVDLLIYSISARLYKWKIFPQLYKMVYAKKDL